MRTLPIAFASAFVLWLASCGSATPTDPGDDQDPQGFMHLEEGQAMIVAAQGGATVEMRALESGETLALRDGERVELKEQFAAEGMGRAEAQVFARDQLGVVPNPRVATEARFVRRPEHKVIVFSAVRTCDPKCVSEIWVLHHDGWRIKVTEEGGTRAPVVAFSPDGGQVAIGAGGLSVVELPGGKVQRWKEFTSPAYGADGTLFVRGVGLNDAVYTIGEFGRGIELYGEQGTAPKAADGTFTDPPPVTFVDGKPTAEFSRGKEKTTVTLPTL